MSSAPQSASDTPARSERELVSRVGEWVMSVLRTEPGWDSMLVEFKPQGGRVHLRVVENRGGTVIPGAAGPVKEDSSVLELISELQRSCHVPGRGSWFSAAVTLVAQGWPEPTLHTSASYHFEDMPHTYAQEGPYTGADVLAQLSEFPRTQERTPLWAVELAESAGLTLPYADPAEDESHGDVHPRLRAAAEAYVREPGERALAGALREALAGTVLLDVSGSQLVPAADGQPVGPESHIRVQTVSQPDGRRALAVYTAADEAREMFSRSSQDTERTEPILLRQRASAVLAMVAQDPQYHEIVVDPASEHALRIPREQIEWVARSPHNEPLKQALLDDNMANVLGALFNPDGHLMLGTRDEGENTIPVMVRPEQEGAAPDTLLVFTSAAEVAALDPALTVRSAPSRQILEFALDAGAAAICLNAMAPVATLPTEQLREMLELIGRREEGDAAGQGGTPAQDGSSEQSAASAPGGAGQDDVVGQGSAADRDDRPEDAGH
ncbi:SseB family protein [Kocuria tytonis]|uniref:SseB family protein n=1 Tax=Kocuria tytonis TaxID=2054280 RepID=A0A495AAC5_9MICC|nr:SseB family protein [Kocuria tytonis]RKQ36989.1 SseB family protein [Kocuria tytonis]